MINSSFNYKDNAVRTHIENDESNQLAMTFERKSMIFFS